MTSFEIITLMISLASLCISFGMLLITLLAFLDKRNKRK